MTSLSEIAREFGGQDEPFKKGKTEYIHMTVQDMAEATSGRLVAAIDAAAAGQALSPFVRKLFDGYEVKIGYGNHRIEKLKGFQVLNFPSLEHVADYLKKVCELIREGECDAAFERYLAERQERAEKAAETRRRKKEEEAIAA